MGGKQVAKIGDYGLSKALDQAGLSGKTMTGNVVGTGRRRLVCDDNGIFPAQFAGSRPVFAVLQTDAVPVRDRTYAIPQPLATVIDRALIDNLEIYYKSAAEFKQVLLNSIS